MKGKKIPAPITASVTAAAPRALVLELKWRRGNQAFSSMLWDLPYTPRPLLRCPPESKAATLQDAERPQNYKMHRETGVLMRAGPLFIKSGPSEWEISLFTHVYVEQITRSKNLAL